MNTSKLALWLSWLAGLILVLLPFHAFFTTWAGGYFAHLDLWRIWKEILIALMVIPTAWLAWQSPKLRQWLGRAWLPRLIAIYIILHVAFGIWAITTGRVNASALIYALLINLRFLIFFLVCLVLASYSDWLKRTWHYLLLVPGTAVVVFGLVQRFLLPYDFLRHFGYNPKTIPAYQTVDATLDFRRIQSTLRGANPLGAYLSLFITAVAGWRYRRMAIKWLTLAAALVVLYFTYSRSAYLGTAISLVLLVWWTSGKKLHPGVLAIAAGLVGLLVAGSLLIINNSPSLQDTFFHTSRNSTSKVSSNAERWQAIKRGLSDVYHQPLGGGPGTAGPASFRDSGHKPRVAEDYYLQVGQEVGVAGMVLFISISVLVAKELWRRRADLLSRILLASLAGIAFINLLSHAWADDTLSLIWWGLAGIALGSTFLNNKLKHKGISK